MREILPIADRLPTQRERFIRELHVCHRQGQKEKLRGPPCCSLVREAMVKEEARRVMVDW